jgi:hypothetical protein
LYRGLTGRLDALVAVWAAVQLQVDGSLRHPEQFADLLLQAIRLADE